MKPLFVPSVAAAMLLLASCTNPYDPGQRAVGGGLLGVGAGAALGAAAGGGGGAATGALVGGAVGALAGVATTPAPPAYAYGAPPRRLAYRRCAPGWHFVRGHRNRWGHWVRAHCARNRY